MNKQDELFFHLNSMLNFCMLAINDALNHIETEVYKRVMIYDPVLKGRYELAQKILEHLEQIPEVRSQCEFVREQELKLRNKKR